MNQKLTQDIDYDLAQVGLSVTEMQQYVKEVMLGKTSRKIQCDLPTTVSTSCVYADFENPQSSTRSSSKDDAIEISAVSCDSKNSQSSSRSSNSDSDTVTDGTFLGNLSTKIQDILDDIDNENNSSLAFSLVQDQLLTCLDTIAFIQRDYVEEENFKMKESKSRHSQTSNGKLSDSDFMTAQESAIQSLILQNKILLDKQESNNRRQWRNNRGRYK